MSRRDEIEASLRTAMDRELLAVYADVLQTEGDPRGELIALDLHADAHGLSHELASRRVMLLRNLVEYDGGGIRSKFGWLDVDLSSCEDLTPLARVLGSPFAQYLRDVVVWGAAQIEAAVAMLAQAPRPWLVRLSLEGSATGRNPIVDHAATTALARATPYLARLELRGGRILDGLDHPAVQMLRVHGRTTIASVVGDRAMLDGVETIDLVVPAEPASPRFDLPADRLPALRRLDLGRNAPPELDHFVDCVALVEPLPILAQLTHLRLPVLRSVAEAQRLDAIVARMPNLVELEISAHLSELRPAVTVDPKPRSWRCIDRVHSRAPLRVEVSPDPDLVIELDIGEAADVLEACYVSLPDDARAAWDTWFNMSLRGQEWGGPQTHRQTVPATRLREALAPCIDRFTSHGWRALYSAIEHTDRPLHYWTY